MPSPQRELEKYRQARLKVSRFQIQSPNQCETLETLGSLEKHWLLNSYKTEGTHVVEEPHKWQWVLHRIYLYEVIFKSVIVVNVL